MVVVLFLAVAAASVQLPSTFASSWDVKMVGGPPELRDFEMALWVSGDNLHQKMAFPNETVVSYPDYLVLGAPSHRACFYFDPANFTCEVQCDPKRNCGDCATCNSFTPLFSEFEDPQTTTTQGCGGLSSAVLYNVTVLHTVTSILCFDPVQQRPLYYKRSTDAYSFTASIVAFTVTTSPSDFDVPSYCNCTHTTTERTDRPFSFLVAK